MGERAGNAPLDEVVVGMHDFLGMATRVRESKLVQVSERVDVVSGRRVPPNKAISGANAFTQTAGIHADGDRKGDLYQGRLLPERFGRERSYALGKLAGKATLEHHLDALGIELSGEQRGAVLERVKELADRKATITQQDLPYIVDDVLARPHERHFLLESVVVVSAIGLRSTATVKLRYTAPGGEETTIHEDSAQGDGGYDAFMNAVGLITGGIGFALPELIDLRRLHPPRGPLGCDRPVHDHVAWRRRHADDERRQLRSGARRGGRDREDAEPVDRPRRRERGLVSPATAKLWYKGGHLDPTVERFTVGDDRIHDRKLLKADAVASLAHAGMLGAIGILTGAELAALQEALQEAIAEVDAGRFRIGEDEEDGHSALERFLTGRVGEAGKKIHTGRSRNDQVIGALRLYTREWLLDFRAETVDLVAALLRTSPTPTHARRWPAGPTCSRRCRPPSGCGPRRSRRR